MRIPGEVLKKYVRFGSPSLSGHYVCWLKPKDTPKMSCIPISPIRIKEYSNGKWLSPDHVLSWLGPLPVYALDELIEEGDKADLIAYVIGTKEGAKKQQFKKGPFNESIYTQFEEGEPGDFVFEVHPNKDPKIIKQWSIDDDKWIKYNKIKRTSKFKRKINVQEKEETHFWWTKGTKKQAALGFQGCEKTDLPITKVQGTKGEIIWNCSTHWDYPYPDFIWNGSSWDNPEPKQANKIQNIVKRLMDKYEKKKETNSIKVQGF